jgi:hypothetical protein
MAGDIRLSVQQSTGNSQCHTTPEAHAERAKVTTAERGDYFGSGTSGRRREARTTGRGFMCYFAGLTCTPSVTRSLG